MADDLQILADHYQKTYEITYVMWKQRNTIFVLLLSSIGAATLLTFGAPQTEPLLIAWVAKLLGISEASGLVNLHASFPFAILQSLLLVVIFYLVVNLYHRALYVLRNYRYLASLELEIRHRLMLPADWVSYTRESTFYWNERPWLLGTVKWVYVLFVGSLLISFLGGRIYFDLFSNNPILSLVDVLISIPTIVFFISYAKSSIVLDRADPLRNKSAHP